MPLPLRFALPLALCALLTTLYACKTAPKPAEDSAPIDAPTTNASTLPAGFPMALPPHTAGVLSIDLERTHTAVNRLVSTLPLDVQRDLQREAPSSLVMHMLVAMFDDMRGTYTSIAEREQLITHMDPAGSVYVATSFQGVTDQIEAMRLGAPLHRVEALPHGVLFRISLPARDPTELMRALQKRAVQEHIERIEVLGTQVELDIRLNSANATRMARGLQPVAIDASTDTTYLSANTHAMQAFLESDAAIKLHIPSSSLIPWTALLGLFQAHTALEYAPPETRRALLDAGMAEASKAFVFDDPTHHEAEDTTLLIDLSATEHLSMSMVRSLTPHGQALERALSAPLEQPVTALPESLFSASMAFDFAAIKGDLEPMREASLYKDPMDLMMHGGPLLFLTRMFVAPMNTRLAMLDTMQDTANAVFFSQAIHVDTSPNMSKTGSPNPMTVIDLLLPTPPPPQTSRLARVWLDIAPFPMSDMLVEGSKVKISMGNIPSDAATSMMTLPRGTFAKARLDLDLLSNRLQKLLPPEVKRNLSPNMFTELSRLSAVNLSATSHDTHTLWHAQTGEQDLSPKVPSTSGSRAQPAGHPDCLVPIIKTSRDALTALSQSSNPGTIPDRLIEQVESFHEVCPGARTQIDIIHARWLTHRAQRTKDPVQSGKDHALACKLGLQLACELVKASTP